MLWHAILVSHVNTVTGIPCRCICHETNWVLCLLCVANIWCDGKYINHLLANNSSGEGV